MREPGSLLVVKNETAGKGCRAKRHGRLRVEYIHSGGVLEATRARRCAQARVHARLGVAVLLDEGQHLGWVALVGKEFKNVLERIIFEDIEKAIQQGA